MPQKDTLDSVGYTCMLLCPINVSHLRFNFLCLFSGSSCHFGDSAYFWKTYTVPWYKNGGKSNLEDKVLKLTDGTVIRLWCTQSILVSL